MQQNKLMKNKQKFVLFSVTGRYNKTTIIKSKQKNCFVFSHWLMQQNKHYEIVRVNSTFTILLITDTTVICFVAANTVSTLMCSH